MKRWAHFSPCGRYRYQLGRQWDASKAMVGWCLKNPASATAEEEDRTSQRVIDFSQKWGYGGCIIANPYAWIATNPENVPHHIQLAIGPKNGQHLQDVGRTCDIVVCGWGPDLPPQVLCWLGGHLRDANLHFLELTKCGAPKHPLYLRGDLLPKEWLPRPMGFSDDGSDLV